MTMNDNLDKRTVIQTVEESVPASLVHDAKQYLENRKLKRDNEHTGIMSELEKL